MAQDQVQRNMQGVQTQKNWQNGMSLVVGVVIILIGVAFLSAILAKSEMANLIPRQTIPILVFLGGVIMTGSGKAAQGLGLMILGLIFILRRFGMLDNVTFDTAWFGILALVGILMALMAQTQASTRR
jgi:predicted membrane channel-forming protein YqfA (hemolysin III family)